MAYIPGVGYVGTPEDLLQNEWIVFIGIFLLTFAIVYYSLSGFFGKTKKANWKDIIEGKGDRRMVHPSALIISLVLALFTAASVSRYGPLYSYFANILGAWVLIFVLIVLFLISFPFFKALRAATGDRWFLGAIIGGFLGGAYYFFLNSYLFYNNVAYDLFGWSYEAYNFLVSEAGMFLLIVAFAIIGAVVPAKPKGK